VYHSAILIQYQRVTDGLLVRHLAMAYAALCICVAYALKGKVKSVVSHEECWWGAHLPYLGLEPVGR